MEGQLYPILLLVTSWLKWFRLQLWMFGSYDALIDTCVTVVTYIALVPYIALRNPKFFGDGNVSLSVIKSLLYIQNNTSVKSCKKELYIGVFFKRKNNSEPVSVTHCQRAHVHQHGGMQDTLSWPQHHDQGLTQDVKKDVNEGFEKDLRVILWGDELIFNSYACNQPSTATLLCVHATHSIDWPPVVKEKGFQAIADFIRRDFGDMTDVFHVILQLEPRWHAYGGWNRLILIIYLIHGLKWSSVYLKYRIKIQTHGWG